MKFALIFLILIQASAYAYVPPSGFILRSFVGKRAGMKSIRIKSTVSAFDDGKISAVHFKETTIYNAQTGAFVSWASDDADQKLYAVDRRANALLPAAQLLFGSQASLVDAALKASGVPVFTQEDLKALPTEEDRRAVEKESLKRWKDKIAWVIGDRFWVEKDTFLPLRWLPEQGFAQEVMELRFENYHSTHEIQVPRMTTALREGEHPIFQDEVTDVSVNLDLRAFKAPESTGFTEAGQASPSALRELIQKYYAVLR